MSKPRVSPGSQTARRALQVLKLLGQNHEEGLTAKEIESVTGVERSAVRRALSSLVEEGLVQRRADGHRFHLGVETMHLGRATIHCSPLIDAYQFSMQRLARLTGDTVFLSTRIGDFVLCVFRDEGSTPVRVPRTRRGDFRVLGTTAGGLAILATLPDEEIRALHARHEPAFTQARMDFATLRKNILKARRSGYTTLSDNVSEGVTSIGICLKTNADPFSAASIAAAHIRMNPERLETLYRLLRDMDSEVAGEGATFVAR